MILQKNDPNTRNNVTLTNNQVGGIRNGLYFRLGNPN